MGRVLQRADAKSEKSEKSANDAQSLGVALMVGGAASRALAQLLKLSISRGAEYDADRVAAELCGADAMISALLKIEKRSAQRSAARGGALAARGGAFAHAY